MRRFVLLVLLNFYCIASWAFSTLHEMEYAEEVQESLEVGEVIWLTVNDNSFLSLYTETEKTENQGTVIILHPMNGHPNQKGVINPLRTYLPKHNWATLSLQMPVLGVEAKEQEYYSIMNEVNARIQAGVDYLSSAGVNKIVLVGYGLGGLMAVNYLQNTPESAVNAIVSISLGVPNSDHKQAQVIDFIRNIKQPFLDIYAEYDLTRVTKTARKRRMAGKASGAYRQFQIEGEGHLFQRDNGLVVKRIYSWINWTFR